MSKSNVEHVVIETEEAGPVHCWKVLPQRFISASRIGVYESGRALIGGGGRYGSWWSDRVLSIALEHPGSVECEVAAMHIRLRSAHEKEQAA